MIPLEDPTTLSLLFHLNSEPWLNDEAYQGSAMNQELKVPENIIGEVPLPRPGGSALMELLAHRRSYREFAQKEMPLEHASALLASGYGAIARPRFGGQTPFLRRTVPSAGGLFPLELYLFTQRVQGLDDGLYHYDVIAHSLQQLRRENLFLTLEPMFYAYPFMKDANVVIAMAAVFLRTQVKYGPRGYRYILLEAGHVAQNVCLRAMELGLETLCMGGFLDSALNALVGLRLKDEGVVYTVAAGFASQPEKP
ncbi:MAG TPA: SagB/ThcOx family dehydrogenase [Pyrinomonadaceae bacterium]|nr:SagB/ThcOx family dehydrogenase [Pyrinomonadaceae bacterium]